MVQPHNRVGIVLAGGKGTRLYPLTKVVSKQLLPVYNKPVIYYPIETLIQTGHQQIIIITKPEDRELFKELILSNKKWSCEFVFLVQEEPKGIPDAFNVAKKYIKNKSSTLILGDNLILGDLSQLYFNQEIGCKVFYKSVSNPSQYGIIQFDNHKSISLKEKPKSSKSNFAIIGIYMFDKYVLEKVKNLKFSRRNELEIIDLLNLYLSQNCLYSQKLPNKTKWFDIGSFSFLFKASSFIQKKLNKKCT